MEQSWKINKITAINIFTTPLFILALYLSFLYGNIPTLTISLLMTFIIMIFPLEHVIGKLFALMYFILLLVLFEGGLIAFNFIPQAKYLLDFNPSVIYWFANGHPHAIRLLIAYPGYIFSELFKSELNIGFSYYGIIMFTIIYLLIIKILMGLKKLKKLCAIEINMFLVLIPLLILPLIMNGRIIPAYVGYILLIGIFVDLFYGKVLRKIKIIFVIFLGLILTMVSSGTMTVALLYLLFMIFLLNRSYLNRKKFIRKALLIILLLSPVIYKLFSYFWLMLMRNINFFGGGANGALNMLNHGLGKYFLFNSTLLVAALAFAFIALFLNIEFLKRVIKNNYSNIPIIIAINISAYGLLFGFSTGSMMIPPLIILVLQYFFDRRNE